MPGRRSSEETEQIAKLMRGHVGEVLNFRDVASTLSLDEKIVNNALARLARLHPERGIRRVGRGQYQYRPGWTEEAARPVEFGAKDSPVLALEDALEVIGHTAAGDVLVRDVNNTVYKLGNV